MIYSCLLLAILKVNFKNRLQFKELLKKYLYFGNTNYHSLNLFVSIDSKFTYVHIYHLRVLTHHTLLHQYDKFSDLLIFHVRYLSLILTQHCSCIAQTKIILYIYRVFGN